MDAAEEVELNEALTGSRQAEEEAKTVIHFEEVFWNQLRLSATSCYAVQSQWWSVWCAYSGLKIVDQKPVLQKPSPDDRPGAINNGGIVKLLEGEKLDEGRHYTCKSPETWEYLMNRYPGSGPACELGMKDGMVQIPALYRVRRSSQDQHKAVDIRVAPTVTIRALKEVACKAVGVEEGEVQMWDYYNNMKYSTEPLDKKMDAFIDSVNLLPGQLLLLEEKVDGEWPKPEPRKISSSLSFPAYQPITPVQLDDAIVLGSQGGSGKAGLSNLGNTCFMNSSVQCLAHVVPLMRIFLSNAYKADINRSNPLGTKGVLTEAFAALMSKLWQAGAKYVSPRQFKAQIAACHPHFAGYNQHDSQELLACLLDSLHEDLNRVKDKPYMPLPDSDGRPDKELAEEAWRNYRARNDSFIADYFQGLYKSTLICPDCGYSSVTMDTFNCLSLPLPAAKMRNIQVTLVCMDGSAPPTLYNACVLKLGTMKQLYGELAKLCGMQVAEAEELLLVVETRDGRIQTKFTDMAEPLADAITGDMKMLAYRYPSAAQGPTSGGKELHIFQRSRGQKKRPYAAFKEHVSPWFGPKLQRRKRQRSSFLMRPSYFSQEQTELFAAPLLLWLPEEEVKGGEGEADQPQPLLHPQGPLSSAVETALRPFKRQKIESAKSSSSEDQVAQFRPDSRDSQDAQHSYQFAPSEPSDQPQCYGEHMTEAHSEGTDLSEARLEETVHVPDVDMEESSSAIEIASPGETPQGSPDVSPDASCPATPKTQSAASDSDASQTVAPLQFGPQRPFDMFSAQQLTEEHMQDNDSGEGHQPPYRLSSTNAYGRSSSFPASRWSMDDGELYFAIDWAANASQVYDPESMEQPVIHSSVTEARQRENAGPKSHSLDECIEAFCEGERLEDSETWSCKQCKKKVQAHKKLDLWSLPEVLVVHLKRFSYSRRWKDKIDDLVQFPLDNWDLSDATLQKMVEPQLSSQASLAPTDGDTVYELFAVSNHYGGMGGGHYTAYCKLNDEQQWYCFDDSSVTQLEPRNVVTESAYVLFYRRRSEARQDAGKSSADLVEGWGSASPAESEWVDVSPVSEAEGLASPASSPREEAAGELLIRAQQPEDQEPPAMLLNLPDNTDEESGSAGAGQEAPASGLLSAENSQWYLGIN